MWWLSPTLPISDATYLNGMIGFLGTRRHVNDLTRQDQGDDVKDVNMVVHGIASRGELVLFLDK